MTSQGMTKKEAAFEREPLLLCVNKIIADHM